MVIHGMECISSEEGYWFPWQLSPRDTMEATFITRSKSGKIYFLKRHISIEISYTSINFTQGKCVLYCYHFLKCVYWYLIRIENSILREGLTGRENAEGGGYRGLITLVTRGSAFLSAPFSKIALRETHLDCKQAPTNARPPWYGGVQFKKK